MRYVATATILIIILIVTFFVVYYSRRNGRDFADILDHEDVHFEEMLQIQNLYNIPSLDEFRTYNPCVFTIGKYGLPYFVYRVSNFTMCRDRKNKGWNSKKKDEIESHTFIYSPNGEIFKISHDVLAKPTCVRGCEDSRTVVNGDFLYIFCNASSGSDCSREMYEMKIPLSEFTELENGWKPIFEGSRRYVREIIPEVKKLRMRTKTNQDEKNWMPFFVDDVLHFVYSVNPHIVMRENNGYVDEVFKTYNDVLPGNLRGGSQVIPVTKWNSGPDEYVAEHLYLSVIHVREGHKKYVTYFYAFDVEEPYRVKYITKGFVFEDNVKRVQMATGLAKVYENEGDGKVSYLYITYGQDDCYSKLCKVSEESIMKSLVSV